MPAPMARTATAAPADSITSLLYQPNAMRWRNVTVATNTTPRSAQSAPGGMQAVAIIEPILSKAARKLGLDQVALRRINCPEGKAEYGPPNARASGATSTSCFLKQALDEGAKQFKWSERVAQKPKQAGTKVAVWASRSAATTAAASALTALIVLTPEGRVQIHSGIGNLGTEAVIDVHRAAAEVLEHSVGCCRYRLGRYLQALAVYLRLGRQPDRPRHDARRARGGPRVRAAPKEVAAKTHRRSIPRLRSRQPARLPQRRRRKHELCAGRASGHQARRHLRRPRSES